MFLDDELLEMCRNAECNTSEQVSQLMNEVYKKCEKYCKSKITPTTIDKELKIILDRTFNLFNSFVRMALKSNDNKLRILGIAFEKFTFKEQFLNNEVMAQIYINLC